MALCSENETVNVNDKVGILREEEVKIFERLGQYKTIHPIFFLHCANILEQQYYLVFSLLFMIHLFIITLMLA